VKHFKSEARFAAASDIRLDVWHHFATKAPAVQQARPRPPLRTAPPAIAPIQLAAVNDPIGTISRTVDTTPVLERRCRDLSTVSHVPFLQHDRTAVAR